MRFFTFLFLFLFVFALIGLAQPSFTVIGPTEVCPNETDYYTFNDFYPAQDFSPSPMSEFWYIWGPTGGGTLFNSTGIAGRELTLGPGAVETWSPIVGVTWNNNSSDSPIISTSISVQTLFNAYYNPYDGGGTIPGNYAYYGISDPITLKIPFGSVAIVPTGLQLSSTTLCPGSTVNLTANSSSGIINLSSTSPVQVFRWQVTHGSTTEVFYNQTNPFTYNVPSTLSPNQTVTFNVNVQFDKCPTVSSSSAPNTATVLPPAPTVSVTPTNVICTTAGQVSINATSPGVSQVIVRLRNITDGTQTPDAQYPTSNISNYTNLTAGDYQLQVENYPSGCFTTATPFTISVQQTSLSASATPSNPLCNGGLGSITAGSLNANSGLQFSIPSVNGGAYQSSNLFSVSAGSYTINAQDSYGCTGSASTSLTEPSALSISPGITSNYNGEAISCSGKNNGEITISGSGGTGPYTYSLNGGTYQPSGVYGGLYSGTYTTSIQDANGCTQAGSNKILNDPPVLVVGAAIGTDPLCNGDTGQINLSSASGGTGTITYSVSPSVTTSPQVVGTPITLVPPNVAYTITAKDANNCQTSAGTVTLTQPTAVAGSITPPPAFTCYSTTNSTTLDLTASGGTPGSPAYTFKWNTNDTSEDLPILLGTSLSTTYSVTIKDGNGCSGTTSVAVTQPPQLIATPTPSNFNGYNISCKGGNNGSISLAPSGGTPGTSPPYTYSWTNASWSLPKTTQNISGLSKGSYSVMVTDSKACTATTSITMTEPPTAISVLFQTKNDVTCFGFNDGSITVSGTGGVGAMHYKDSTATSASAYQLSNNLVSLAADTYFIRAKDANGCVGITPGVIIDTPTALSITEITKTDPDCAGAATGSLQVTATGGTPPYQYSNNGGTLSSSSTFSPLASVLGGYIISVQDANSCNTLSTAQELTDPPALTVSATSVSESYDFAGDGKINVTASGGTGTIMYSKDGIAFQSGAAFDNLSGGLYTITVKDEHNCIQTADAFVASTPPPPSSITCSSGQLLSVSVTNQIDPTCGLPNGSTQVTATGGSGTFSFQWLDALGRPAGTDASLQSISSGTYNVRVTDSNNCLVGTSVTLAPYTATQFSVININSALCSNSVDGSASMQVTSGQAPYTQVWSSGETTTAASKLPGGQNTITVTDGNGCNVTKTFQVPSPLAITAVKETIINPVCTGGSDGSIQVLATGGTGVLSYTWNGTAGSNVIQNVKEGTYNLIIKDGNNCTFTKSYSLVDPTRFTIDLGPDVTICPKTTAQIGLTLPNATYTWSGPNGFTSTAGVVNVGDAGTYLLKLINAIGCQASDDIAVSISNNLLKSDFLMVSEASVGDTIIVIDISWPIPDQIEWHLGDSATVVHADNDYALITYNDPGIYTVGVKATMGGCSDEYYQQITIDKENKNKGGREASGPDIESFVAYPNPFEGKTNLSIALSQSGDASVKVYCLSTNLMIVSHQFEGEKKYDVELDLNGGEAGVYIIVLEAGAKTKSVKVIKL